MLKFSRIAIEAAIKDSQEKEPTFYDTGFDHIEKMKKEAYGTEELPSERFAKRRTQWS